jgi:hypothetical protein
LAFENVQSAMKLFPGIFDRPMLRKSYPFFPPKYANINLKSSDKYDLYAKAMSKIYNEGVDAAQKEIEEALGALRID